MRGIIHLPIIGAAETFRWGVWGSLSRENFETLLKMDEDPKRIELPPFLRLIVSGYSGIRVLNQENIQEFDRRPHLELEPTGHPLSQEYHKGIAPERVKEIMMGRLRGNE